MTTATTTTTDGSALFPEPFWGAEEADLATRFMHTGYLILPVEERAALDRIRDLAVELAATHLGVPIPSEPGVFLDRIHERVTPERLNDLRLAVIGGFAMTPWLRPAYFSLARRAIETVVGNELSMQRRLNLSIQLPDDESSLLPIHSDVWNGDSPFEVVEWLPLVSCHGTKSMFIAGREADALVQREMASVAGRSAETLYRTVEKDLTFLTVPYGHVLLFTQNIMHGNRINREPDTRWSMNCRFKSVLSPYVDKKLGEFFEPISIRPATRLGATYRLPTGFHE